MSFTPFSLFNLASHGSIQSSAWNSRRAAIPAAPRPYGPQHKPHQGTHAKVRQNLCRLTSVGQILCPWLSDVPLISSEHCGCKVGRLGLHRVRRPDVIEAEKVSESSRVHHWQWLHLTPPPSPAPILALWWFPNGASCVGFHFLPQFNQGSVDRGFQTGGFPDLEGSSVPQSVLFRLFTDFFGFLPISPFRLSRPLKNQLRGTHSRKGPEHNQELSRKGKPSGLGTPPVYLRLID